MICSLRDQRPLKIDVVPLRLQLQSLWLLHETDKRPVADPDHLSAPPPPRGLCVSPSPHCLKSRENHWHKSNGGRVYLGCRRLLCHANHRISKQQIQLLGTSMLLKPAFKHCKVEFGGYGKTSGGKKTSFFVSG